MRCRYRGRALESRATVEPRWVPGQAGDGPRQRSETSLSASVGLDKEAANPSPAPAHSYIDGRIAAKTSWSKPGTESSTETGHSSMQRHERSKASPTQSDAEMDSLG